MMVLLPMLPMLLDWVGRASGLDAGNQPLSVALRPCELKRGAWSASCEDCQGLWLIEVEVCRRLALHCFEPCVMLTDRQLLAVAAISQLLDCGRMPPSLLPLAQDWVHRWTARLPRPSQCSHMRLRSRRSVGCRVGVSRRGALLLLIARPLPPPALASSHCL